MVFRIKIRVILMISSVVKSSEDVNGLTIQMVSTNWALEAKNLKG